MRPHPTETERGPPWKLDQSRILNVLSQVPAARYRKSLIIDAVQNERGDADYGENMPDVDLSVHSRERGEGGGARAQSKVARPPLAEVLIMGHGWGSGVDPDRRTPVTDSFGA